MALTLEQVRHIAKLARLQLSEEEMLAMLPHLQEMVDLFDRLRQVDTQGLEPTSHPVPVVNVWRDDATGDVGCGPELLAASVHSRNGLFLVPAILDEGEV